MGKGADYGGMRIMTLYAEFEFRREGNTFQGEHKIKTVFLLSSRIFEMFVFIAKKRRQECALAVKNENIVFTNRLFLESE